MNSQSASRPSVSSASYHWQARTMDSAGAASAWVAFGGNSESAADFTVAVSTGPAAPSNLTATAASASQINGSWQDNAGDETEFRIERKTGAGGTYSQIATVGANVTSYANTGLGSSTTYYYRVRACNAALEAGAELHRARPPGGDRQPRQSLGVEPRLRLPDARPPQASAGGDDEIVKRHGRSRR